ncbi:MAG TPA: VWA domain-containing protein [Pyrinomonadaceae bacterium]|jgi:VWFA-related protein|nr:VWA domain-containing protein [Pyrinomonadaceae bacterium]
MIRTNKSRWPVILLLLTVVALLLLPHSSITSAQKRTSPRPTKPKSARPKASPTPTPSAVDALGAPPPVPTLKQKREEQEVTPGDVISVNTTEVMIPVTVRDSNGRLVNDLTRSDFRVFENENEQPLSDLALRQVPVDVVLMVDASSSVASNLEDFRRAAEGFAERLADDDRISLIKFDDRVELLQDWTKSRFQLRRALARIEPGMFTRFNDALLLAAREQFGDTKSRRAIIVLSDGIDSGRGTATLETAVQALLRSQISVYVVSNTEISRAAKRAELDSLTGGSDAAVRFNQLRIDDLRTGLRVLDLSELMLAQLTATTGGKLYKPQSFAGLESTYAEVAEELRHQYALYYTPLNKTRDGGFRRIRVQMTNPAYQGHTRVGYFAPKS